MGVPTGNGNYPPGVTDNDPHFDNRKDEQSDACERCGKPVYGWVEEYCCSGFECGCMGKPTSPCWCMECWAKWDEQSRALAAGSHFTSDGEPR